MGRRIGLDWLRLLAGIVLFIGSSMTSATTTTYLEPTLYIDSKHPALVQQVSVLTLGAKDEVEKAIRIHNYVRDEILFGWAGAFYDQKASGVLEAKLGFCNTKSTLFVAMLRAAGIPAKQRFVNINAKILEGILSPGTEFVDHSYTEVLLQGRWIKLDSYIVDKRLAEAARRKLQGEGRMLGYGVHRNGTSDWDGRSDAFSQFLNDGSVANLSTQDFGVFEDVGAFYRSGNELNPGLRLIFRWVVASANKRAEALRQ
jgi:hypothetical protein